MLFSFSLCFSLAHALILFHVKEQYAIPTVLYQRISFRLFLGSSKRGLGQILILEH